MDDTATGVFIGLRPFEVVVHSSSLTAPNREQSQQRSASSPLYAATHYIHAAPTTSGAISTNQLTTTTLSDDQVVAVAVAVAKTVKEQPDDTGSASQQTHSNPMLRDPKFKLRIRCRQVIEQFTPTTTTTSSVPTPIESSSSPSTITIATPCRVKDGRRICVEHNHFINGTNVTHSVIQGQPVLTTFNSNAEDQVVPEWLAYGISSIELEIPHGDLTTLRNKFWFNFQPNDLPPPGKHLDKKFLKYIILDCFWITDSPTVLHDRLVQQPQASPHTLPISNSNNSSEDTLSPSTSTTSATHSSSSSPSLETMVMQTGLNRVLVALAKDHQPLIFSPKRMRWFSSVMEDNKRIVNSLMGIYQNTTGVEIKDSMNQSFQRMQAQFPSVPQGNRHLLLATAFEAQTYKVVMAGGLPTLGGQPRRGRSRTAAMTAVASAGRDDAPLHKSTTGAVINVGDEALTSVALPFVSNDSDGAREPPPQQQQQQQQQLLLQRQWRRQLFGGTNEKQVEELGLQSTYEIYQSTIPDGPQLVEREPAAKHFVSSWSSNIHSSPSSSSSSSSNDNTNNINKYSIDALVPDNSSRFITPITTTPTATTTTTTETTAAAAAAATPIAGGNAQKFGVEFNQNADLDMDMSSFDDFDFDRDDFYEMDENGGCI